MSNDKNYYLKLRVLLGFRQRMLGNSVSGASQPVSQSFSFFQFGATMKNTCAKRVENIPFLFIHFKSTCVFISFRSFFRFPNEHDRRHIHRWNNKPFNNCLFILSFFFFARLRFELRKREEVLKCRYKNLLNYFLFIKWLFC